MVGAIFDAPKTTHFIDCLTAVKVSYCIEIPAGPSLCSLTDRASICGMIENRISTTTTAAAPTISKEILLRSVNDTQLPRLE
jgi:hypothetical protein